IPAALRWSADLPSQPRQVIRIAGHDRYSDYFGHLVRVERADPRAHGLETLGRGLDEQQSLRVVANPAFPAIHGPDPGYDVDAGSQALVDERRRNRAGELRRVRRRENEDFTHEVVVVSPR